MITRHSSISCSLRISNDCMNRFTRLCDSCNGGENYESYRLINLPRPKDLERGENNMEIITSCDTCIHEKVCSHKEKYRAITNNINGLISENLSSLFKTSVLCKEYALKGSCGNVTLR